MVKSMFAAVAGLRAHQAKLDVIGNNIANVNTYGYKTARATFRDVFYATSTAAGEAGEVYGGTNPMQLGYGSQIASVDSMMTQGGTAATDNPSDCMIVGNGFFLVGIRPKYAEDAAADEKLGIPIGVEGDDGGGGGGADGADPNEALPGGVNQEKVSALKFTRVGIFNIDGAGNFVDSNGMFVYGFGVKDDTDTGATSTVKVIDYAHLKPIQLPMKKPAGGAGGADDEGTEPIELKNITIGSDGRITGINDKDETVLVGQIALANVPNPNALERVGNSYYSMRGNTGRVTVNPSGRNSTGKIKAGTLEMANVDLSKEFTDMITTQRGFQANTRIITVTDTMLEELVNLKR